jgi:hypothetical protein
MRSRAANAMPLAGGTSGTANASFAFNQGKTKTEKNEGMKKVFRIEDFVPEGTGTPNRCFARLRDPEGNPIELREPAGRDAKR